MSIDYSLYYTGKHFMVASWGTGTGDAGSWTWTDPRLFPQILNSEITGVQYTVPTYNGVYLMTNQDWEMAPSPLGIEAIGVSPDGAHHAFVGDLPSTFGAPFMYETDIPPARSADVSGYAYGVDTSGYFSILDSNGVGHLPSTPQAANGSFPLYIDRGYPSPMVNLDPNSQLYTTITDLNGRTLPYTNVQGLQPIGTPAALGSSHCPTGMRTVVSAFEVDFPGPTDAQGHATVDKYYFCYVSIVIHTNFQASMGGAWIAEATMPPMLFLQSVKLPNNTSWLFEYDDRDPSDNPTATTPVNYGSLTKVTYPTGAFTTYQYQTWNTCTDQGDGTSNSRYLTRKSESISPSDPSPAVWTYGINNTLGLGNELVSTPDGRTESYTFAYSGGCPAWLGTFQDGAGTTKTYVDAVFGAIAYTQVPGNEWSYVVTQEVTTSPDGRAIGTLKYYDTEPVQTQYFTGTLSHGNVVEEYTYDPIDSSIPSLINTAKNNGTPLPFGVLTDVKTRYDYQSNTVVANTNLVTLVSDKATYDGLGNKLAEVENTYADSSDIDFYGGLTGGRNFYWPGFLTSTSNLVSAGSSPTWATQTFVPDRYAGHVVIQNDGDGNPTTYGRSVNDVYVTSVTRGEDIYGVYGYNIDIPSPKTYSSYDPATDQLISQTDANGNTTTYTYGPLERLIQVKPPAITGVGQPETDLCYTDMGTCPVVGSTPLTVVSTTRQGANWVTLSQTYDGFGRPTESTLYDNQGPLKTVTTYDILGRKKTVTNPFRTASDPTYGITTYTYAYLGDPATRIDRPDGSYTTNILGYTAWDGKNLYLPVIDTFGRLASVAEPNGTTTYYTYDPLNNLTRVNQAGLVRQFTYDSMSRLVASANPETGTVNYAYDGASNLIAKTDARGVTVNMQYDVLNRIVAKSYSGPGTSNSMISCYEYDAQTSWQAQNNYLYGLPAGLNFRGRLAADWTQVPDTSLHLEWWPATPCTQPGADYITAHIILGYDAEGHVTSDWRCVRSSTAVRTCVQTTNTYDLAGNLTQYTTSGPQGKAVTVTNSYDSANRLQQVLAQMSRYGTSILPATSMYAVHSFSPVGPVSADIGSTMTTNFTYDSMMRPTSETTAVK